MLALALGGCFCNDLRYAADEIGVALGQIAVSVTVELEGSPLLTTAATMSVTCEMQDGSDASPVIEKAKAICTVANSLGRGFPVAIAQAGHA